MIKGMNKEKRVDLDGFLTLDFQSVDGYWRGLLSSLSCNTVKQMHRLRSLVWRLKQTFFTFKFRPRWQYVANFCEPVVNISFTVERKEYQEDNLFNDFCQWKIN